MIVTSATSLPWGFIGKEQEWRLLQVYDVGNHKAYPVPSLTFTDPNLKLMNVISGPVMIRRLQGHTVLFVPGIYVEHETLAALFRVDLDTATQTLVRKGASPSQKCSSMRTERSWRKRTITSRRSIGS